LNWIKNDILPYLGDFPLKDITIVQMQEVIDSVKQREKLSSLGG